MKFLAKKVVSCVEYIEDLFPGMHIFHIEDIFVASVLIITALIFRENYAEWIGITAVFLTFKHNVISFRLEAAEENREEQGKSFVKSYKQQSYYFYAKELVWFAYFLLLGAWSGLVGVCIFLLYPSWHTIRERYHTKRKNKKLFKK